MSGTSCDGLDIVYCSFECLDDEWSYEIKYFKTYSYSDEWQSKLKNSIYLSALDLLTLDIDYGNLCGDLISDFIENNQIEEIDFIASHGHTVFHQPDKGFSLQIGNAYEIQKKNPYVVINNFRNKDISLGGQGAPLVPIGDQLLFSDYDYCLNIGGITNISYQNDKNHRIAKDICFANMTLNYLCNKIGLEYDKDGKIASSHKVDDNLYNEILNKSQNYNSSLSKELFDKDLKPILENFQDIKAAISTATKAISKLITNCIVDKSKNILVSGGGAYNKTLINHLKFEGLNIIIPDSIIIDSKEALIFGFLGVLKLESINNCLASVTGAIGDSCGGIINN